MNQNPVLTEYFLTRRTVTAPFLTDPGPDAQQLETLLTIASRVPDHGKLAPWRFMIYEGDARILAGERLAEIAEQSGRIQTTEQAEAERKQFLPAPLTIGVVSTAAPHVKIPEVEQLLAAGNVCFNLCHGANALGFGAHWVTRWFAFDPDAAQMLGAKPGERFVGFVHIGTATATLEDRDRPDIARLTTRWQG